MSTTTLPQLDPMSHGTMTVTVTAKNEAGVDVPVTDATVTAAIFHPSGRPVPGAQAIPVAHDTAGQYLLSILPAWSTDANLQPVTGVFTARVTIVVNGRQRVREFPYHVAFLK